MQSILQIYIEIYIYDGTTHNVVLPRRSLGIPLKPAELKFLRTKNELLYVRTYIRVLCMCDSKETVRKLLFLLLTHVSSVLHRTGCLTCKPRIKPLHCMLT